MNYGRCKHSSVLHNHNLFVIAGNETTDGQKVNCMEYLDLQNSASWVTIDEGNPLISPRSYCLLSSFSPHEILVAGGKNNGLLSDVYLYDVRTSTVSQVEAPSANKFSCFSKPALVGVGKLVALIIDSNGCLNLIRIER